MKRGGWTIIRSAKGMTLPEVLTVCVIIAIMAAIATPYYIKWIQNTDYRSAARHAVSILRQAKSNAIATNREQQVVFMVKNNRYSYATVGSPQSYATPTASWPGITSTMWVPMPSEVKTGATKTIQFTPNGLMSSPTGTTACTIPINDIGGTKRYDIIVSAAGRISINGPFAY